MRCAKHTRLQGRHREIVSQKGKCHTFFGTFAEFKLTLHSFNSTLTDLIFFEPIHHVGPPMPLAALFVRSMKFTFVGDGASNTPVGEGRKSKVRLGPLDQRLRRRRCDNCARAHRGVSAQSELAREVSLI